MFTERPRYYWILARFDRPIGTLILLYPALWALWIASQGRPNFLVLTVIIFGVIVMRAAGCVINDYADRDFDPHVERTKQRPIAAGNITPKAALIFFAALCLLAFGLVLLLNTFTILLSFVGAFLAASYPFMKRYTHLPQAYLGIAFGWAVPMSFAAQLNEIPTIAWVLYLAVILWAMVWCAGVESGEVGEGGNGRCVIIFENRVQLCSANSWNEARESCWRAGVVTTLNQYAFDSFVRKSFQVGATVPLEEGLAEELHESLVGVVFEDWRVVIHAKFVILSVKRPR